MRKNINWFDWSWRSVIISCALLGIVFMMNMLNIPPEESYHTNFNIQRFPKEYRQETRWGPFPWNGKRPPDFQQWQIIWYAQETQLIQYQFKDEHLKTLWGQLLPILSEPHPIFERLNIPQESGIIITDFDTLVRFSDQVNTLATAHNLWNQEAYLVKKDGWERRQTQAYILGLYLIYLDERWVTPNQVLLNNIESLIEQMGQANWYETFDSHLNSHH